MADGKTLRLDLIVIVLLLGAVLAGLWMTGAAMAERTEALQKQISTLQGVVGGVSDKVVEVHNIVLKGSPPAPAAAAPAAAPAAAHPPAPAAAHK